MRSKPKNLKRNLVSLLPWLLFSERKKMQHLLNELRFSTGTTKMERTKVQQQSVMTSTDSGFTAVIVYSQYLIMPKHLSKELAEPMSQRHVECM